jgi:hypothetical protein|tara:strand:- start:8261 stop:8494 length:234 start_codon:yes stop_codon:yes gene_type:complete
MNIVKLLFKQDETREHNLRVPLTITVDTIPRIGERVVVHDKMLPKKFMSVNGIVVDVVHNIGASIEAIIEVESVILK